MEELNLREPEFVGREEELNTLIHHLDNAIAGKGSTVIISGEPGIGKTRLVEEFKKHAGAEDVYILAGTAMASASQPFYIFSKALAGYLTEQLFEEQEYASFAEIFAVNHAGLLLAKASSETEGVDADVFAGMLSAVQDFVRDSFDRSGEKKAELGRLEYGDMKIIIEHGQHLFLTAVLKNAEHPDMKILIKQAIQKIEKNHGKILEKWDGKMEELKSVQDEIAKLAGAKFLVRKDLEGVRLENERLRIADNVLTLLAEKSKKRPLLILLEDLHWSDESSLFVLNYLARNIGDWRIAVVGSARPGEGIAFQKSLGKMREDEAVNEISLRKFDEKNLFELVDEVFPGNAFNPEFIERLASKCGGNPFFIFELLKQMQVEGKIAKANGKFILTCETYSIPSTIEEMVNRRLETLDSDAMAMAEYGSCIGKEFGRDIACSLKSIKEPGTALEKLCAAGIVTSRTGTICFSHALFQDAIYASMSLKWRELHHRNIGEYYEKTNCSNLDVAIYDLARHFSRSSEHAKAFEYCVRAGLKAENSYAAEQAIEFYETAMAVFPKAKIRDSQSSKSLEFQERLGDLYTLVGSFEKALTILTGAANSSGSNEDRARMLRKIGVVHANRGDFDKSLEFLEMAKAAFGGATSQELGRILLDQGNAHWRKGDYDKATNLVNEALGVFERYKGTDRDRAKVLHTIGTIFTNKGEYASALEYYERSLKAAESANNLYGEAATLNNMGIVHYNKGDLDQALECHERSLAIKEKIGDKSGIAFSHNNIGLVLLDKGEMEGAIAQFERALLIWDKIGNKQGVVSAVNNLGNVYYNTGEFDRSLDYYDRSLKIREKLGDKRGVALVVSNIGNVYLTMCLFDKALEYARRSLEIREEIGDKKGTASSLTNIGAVYKDRGEINVALDFYSRGLKLFEEIGDKNGLIYAYCGLAEAQMIMAQHQSALESALRAVDISVKMGAGGKVSGMSHSVLGSAYLGIGELDRAAEELDKSMAIIEGINQKEETAKLFYAYGLLYKKRGESQKAKDSLQKALAEFKRMGMKLWVEKCKKALAELGI